MLRFAHAVPDSLAADIGRLLRLERERADLTQEQLGLRIVLSAESTWLRVDAEIDRLAVLSPSE